MRCVAFNTETMLCGLACYVLAHRLDSEIACVDKWSLLVYDSAGVLFMLHVTRYVVASVCLWCKRNIRRLLEWLYCWWSAWIWLVIKMGADAFLMQSQKHDQTKTTIIRKRLVRIRGITHRMSSGLYTSSLSFAPIEEERRRHTFYANTYVDEKFQRSHYG